MTLKQSLLCTSCSATLVNNHGLIQLGQEDTILQSGVHETETEIQLTPGNSQSLLILKLTSKIQMNSKLDETCFIVSSTKCTSTHIKESN